MKDSFFAGALLTALVLSFQASAQGYDRGDIVRGLCSKDACDEFAILDKQPVTRGQDGELFRTRVRIFDASAAGRKDGGEENGFVYCSEIRPAIINAPAGGAPIAFFLAPDDTAPAWQLRGSTNFFALYFSLCHGLEAGKSTIRDRSGTARSLGYRVALKQSQTIALKGVEDILRPR